MLCQGCADTAVQVLGSSEKQHWLHERLGENPQPPASLADMGSPEYFTWGEGVIEQL